MSYFTRISVLGLLFVLDAHGMIRCSYVSPVGINPGADGILTALEALQKEETSQ